MREQDDAMTGEEQAEAKQKSLINCPLSYELLDGAGEATAGGEGEGIVTDERLAISPEFGEALGISYRDIGGLAAGDYRVRVNLMSGEVLVISDLGYRYEDFSRILAGRYNAQLLKDLLMEEKTVRTGIEGEYTYYRAGCETPAEDECELRLHETALVLVPQTQEIIRIPFGLMSGVKAGDYTLEIAAENGDKLVLRQLGREYDAVKRELSEQLNALAAKTQTMLQEMLPSFDQSVIRKAARLMRDGRAARRGDLEFAPGLWQELEAKLSAAGLKSEYDFLAGIGRAGEASIGVKRGLMGDLTGEYFWCLMPFAGTDPAKPGNAIALEAVGLEGGGRATYFFRIFDRPAYSKGMSEDELTRGIREMSGLLNHCLLLVNFRREPIYLPEQRLQEPRYAGYRAAVSRLPALRELRARFIGRVRHGSPEQWRGDVRQLLRFNVNTIDNKAKWQKTKEAEPE